jgi:hypothetical protein
MLASRTYAIDRLLKTIFSVMAVATMLGIWGAWVWPLKDSHPKADWFAAWATTVGVAVALFMPMIMEGRARERQRQDIARKAANLRALVGAHGQQNLMGPVLPHIVSHEPRRGDEAKRSAIDAGISQFFNSLKCGHGVHVAPKVEQDCGPCRVERGNRPNWFRCRCRLRLRGSADPFEVRAEVKRAGVDARYEVARLRGR